MCTSHGERERETEKYRDILIQYRVTQRYRVSHNNIARSIARSRACERVIAYRLLDPVQLIRALMAAQLLRYDVKLRLFEQQIAQKPAVLIGFNSRRCKRERTCNALAINVIIICVI